MSKLTIYKLPHKLKGGKYVNGRYVEPMVQGLPFRVWNKDADYIEIDFALDITDSMEKILDGSPATVINRLSLKTYNISEGGGKRKVLWYNSLKFSFGKYIPSNDINSYIKLLDFEYLEYLGAIAVSYEKYDGKEWIPISLNKSVMMCFAASLTHNMLRCNGPTASQVGLYKDLFVK